MTLDDLHAIANDAIDAPERERVLIAALAMCSDLACPDYLRGAVAHLFRFSSRKEIQ